MQGSTRNSAFGAALRSVVCVVVLGVACACQPPLRTTDWSSYDGPGARYFQQEEVTFPHVPDPIEPFNRGVGVFNHVLMVGVAQPISFAYRWLVSPPTRTAVANAIDNARFPVRFFGNLLQGKLEGVAVETGRFLINTTTGLAGLMEVAEPQLGWEPSNEDLGQVFGRWGWDRSTFVQVPLFGPLTIRDGIGRLIDAVVDPLTYLSWASTVRTVFELAEQYPQYQRFVETNFDPYELGKLLYVLSRDLQIEDPEPRSVSAESGETETLELVFLGHEDPYFPDRGAEYTITVPATGRKLPYSAWVQPEPSPLIFFLPGTSGHRVGSSSLAIAEVAFDQGWSVITLASTLNHEFIRNASTAIFPGFVPDDAREAHLVLDAIHADIHRRFPDHFSKQVLAGLSLGGMQTLFIAADADDSNAKLVSFDLYVALNSPVSLRYAVETLDRFYNAPLRYPPEERSRQIESILRRAVNLAHGTLRPGEPLPFTEVEAEFLIGLAFRTTIRDIIYQAQSDLTKTVLKTRGGTWTRTAPYQEVLQFSFMEYIYAFVLPSLVQQRDDIEFTEAGADRLFEMGDLRSVAEKLRGNDRVLFFSNQNDSLLGPGDVEWIRDMWGPEQAILFKRGGHLGNLHREDVQRVITNVIARALGLRDDGESP